MSQRKRSAMIDDTAEGSESSSPADGSGRMRMLTGASFDSLVLQGEGPIAVEFMSYGCAHCREIEPVLQRVAEIVKGKEKIFQVNVAVEQGIAESFEIQGTPTLVMFLNGQEAGRVEGAPPNVASVLAAVTQPFE
jgi:thioredoxin 1